MIGALSVGVWIAIGGWYLLALAGMVLWHFRGGKWWVGLASGALVGALGIGIPILVVSSRSNNACNKEKAFLKTAEDAYFAKHQNYTGMDGLVGGGLLAYSATTEWTVSSPRGAGTSSSYQLSKVDPACPD